MAKILIEFYSEKTPENLISILNEQFQKVVFLYFSQSSPPSPRRKAALSNLVKKLLGFPVEFCEINEDSIAAALKELSRVWQKENEYLVDITGGDEALIAAAGILAEQKKENVTLHQYHVPSGKKLYSYPAAKQTDSPFPHYVSVPDLLSLNGSVPLSAPSYVFTRGPLKGEILKLWNAVKSRPKDWNRYCALSNDQEGSEHSLTEKSIAPGTDTSAYETVSARLKSIRVLTDEQKIRRNGRDYMSFSLDVPQEAEFLYDKAGTILEMYCALCAHETGLFQDVRVGVTVDWNGKISGKYTPDPRNEIDVFLMRENLPIVASCKNTVPQNEHLYEIMVMAKHYGGHFATPALFSSGRATETVRKRASEMGIVLIDGLRFKTFDETVRLFRNVFDPTQIKTK